VKSTDGLSSVWNLEGWIDQTTMLFFEPK
jgi:hypothetical protein